MTIARTRIDIAPFQPADRGGWEPLARGYKEFYKTPTTDAEYEAAWQRLMDPFVSRWPQLLTEILGPLRPPRHPFLLGAFGMAAILPATGLARLAFRGQQARALFMGIAGHATLPLTRPPASAAGLLLAAVVFYVGLEGERAR